MTSNYTLIKQAQATADTHRVIYESVSQLASTNGMTAKGLMESITHVLAGLAQKPDMMNTNSLAALMAGVEKLAAGLSSTEDGSKKQNTLRQLAAAAMKSDQLTKQSLPNHSVVVIAQHGAKFPEVVQKYAKIAGDPAQLSTALKQLQYTIDKAMQQGQQGQQQPTAPSGNSTEMARGPSAVGATNNFQPTASTQTMRSTI